MNRSILCGVVAAALFSTVPKASLASISGNDLLAMCTDQNPETKLISKSSCMLYIDGIIEGVAVMQGLVNLTFPAPDGALAGKIVRQPFCFKEGEDNGVVSNKVVQYLKSNPDKLYSPASQDVFIGLSQIYPCATR